MPFWERRGALERSIESYPEWAEFIVVDDGSPTSPAEGVEGVKVITLPRKDHPLNPCVPINEGMKHATGRLLGLSNPEVVHSEGVLREAVDLHADPLDYVVSPAWCPEHHMWHAHKTLAAHEDMPMAIGHFLAVFSRELWEAIGGFDERFRNGQGYDDTDFIRNLIRVGAHIKWTNRIVTHHKDGATTKWGLPSNREIYLNKWKTV